MYEMFKNFGTSLYLRRGMQKRAFYGKQAVDYLEKVGALAPQQYQQQPQQYVPQQYQQQPQQVKPGLTTPEAAAVGLTAMGGGAAAMGGLNYLGRKALTAHSLHAVDNFKNAFGRELITKEMRSPEMMKGSFKDAIRTVGDKLTANGTRGKMDRIVTRNDKIRTAIGKARNPMIAAGAIGGSLLAGKYLFDRAKAARQSQQTQQQG